MAVKNVWKNMAVEDLGYKNGCKKIRESHSRYIAFFRKYIVDALYRTFYFTFRDCHWFSLIFLIERSIIRYNSKTRRSSLH